MPASKTSAEEMIFHYNCPPRRRVRAGDHKNSFRQSTSCSSAVPEPMSNRAARVRSILGHRARLEFAKRWLAPRRTSLGL